MRVEGSLRRLPGLVLDRGGDDVVWPRGLAPFSAQRNLPPMGGGTRVSDRARLGDKGSIQNVRAFPVLPLSETCHSPAHPHAPSPASVVLLICRRVTKNLIYQIPNATWPRAPGTGFPILSSPPRHPVYVRGTGVGEYGSAYTLAVLI